mmetsp:Transcript_56457/g.89455  ORF Transcript_56457/g.89455 Transcript_56457/m.89455 type:complete len:217 (+) Transcript_56457:136-786(+)
MAFEAVVVEGIHAILRPLLVNKVDKCIAHICHSPFVQGDIQEVEFASKTKVLKLCNKVTLGISIRNVANHQSRDLLLAFMLLIFTLQIDCLRHERVTVFLLPRLCFLPLGRARATRSITSWSWAATGGGALIDKSDRLRPCTGSCLLRSWLPWLPWLSWLPWLRPRVPPLSSLPAFFPSVLSGFWRIVRILHEVKLHSFNWLTVTWLLYPTVDGAK